MTLKGHTQPISALDFTSPYGQLVSASFDQTLKVWDLISGDEIRELIGHKGMIKCLQVEDQICITAGIDGQIRIWDLSIDSSNDLMESNSRDSNQVQEDEDQMESIQSPCIRKLEGHTQPITSLYFDQSCLVTGSSDKTIRQWDLETGQNVLTMDILWAMQHSHSTSSTKLNPSNPSISDFDFDLNSKSSLINSSLFHPNHEIEHDFVGGIQFWGYALASGSADGCVRMWDMRTGQAHRTLVGHTGPIRCLQFDEMHLMSGSVDKTIKVWDLRTGSISDTIKYSDSITSLQFDSRKIISTSGTNHLNVYNRTTLEHSKIDEGNGHLDLVEKFRYLDRYLISGGKDGFLKVWSI
ncbi:WD40-repeat-containing domain protein [Melampsora americana]|nr:WD40-repeat-containing domain protein [Melampsora americana]